MTHECPHNHGDHDEPCPHDQPCACKTAIDDFLE